MKAIATAILSLALATQAFCADGGLKIGYVDMTRVLEQYERRPVLEKQLRDLQNSLSTEDRSRVEELSKMEKEMEQLALGSPERLALNEKYRQSVATTEEFRRKGHEQMNQEYVKMLQSLFQDAVEETGRVGREKEYDFIIKDQSAAEQPRTQPEVILQLSQRVVLYSKAEYDLTDEIVRRLNAKYQPDEANPASAPTAP